MNDIFDSCVRSAGDLAGVFEYDGETGYFYLYESDGIQGQRVLDSIHIISGNIDFGEKDISILWDFSEQKVGLYINSILWAVFDCQNQVKYGGDYKSGESPILPAEATIGFTEN